MNKLQFLRCALVGGASVVALAGPASAKVFDIPEGDLSAALGAYMQQAGVAIVYSESFVRGHKSHGAKGDYTETAALSQILSGTGFKAEAMPSSAIGIVPAPQSAPATVRVAQLGKPAAPPPQQTGLETVVVTAQKKSENIQTVPIAVTAMTQQQLTERQIAGGPDLIRDVPNMNFGKTNFSGYSIELRGIGTQAISVTTDPAVAVAFNDTPFIRNHFFEQEFYDVQDVEVLRGPQGTLYGRNATAGVVNLKSALPTDQYEAMLSADVGNYNNRRLEGMLNLPIVGDTLDLRIAGEWTKRDGYTEDTTLNTPVDGRDLWSGRMTLGWKPASNVQTYLVWEHFSEDDDRLRSGKQLCKTDNPPASVDGVAVPPVSGLVFEPADYLSQGCSPTSLYSQSAFEVPDGYALPYFAALRFFQQINPNVDPYAETTQSPNLRQIQSSILPTYRAKNDTLEFNATYNISPELTFTSQTGYNHDFLWSTEDYNRFDTSPGIFLYEPPGPGSNNALGEISSSGYFCDPQLGCQNRLVAEDLSEEHAWQLSQEFRLASNFSGPLNFSVGANYLHYETEESYYVFINALTLYAVHGEPSTPYVSGVSDNLECLGSYEYNNPKNGGGVPTENECVYIDPHPIGNLDNLGHNYFLSQNPYVLNSYAGFGEVYYQLLKDLQLTGGLRWTDDQKHFIDVPSEVVADGIGYPVIGVVNQQWDKLTGRTVANWTPDLDFTDQTLVYASYGHGYKAGGANPPGAVLLTFQASQLGEPDHPLTFKPEYIDAFELGSKNTLLDNALTLNGDIFFYNYRGYQISQIVDRTAINLNFNATVRGAELESTWEPLPGLKFTFAGGYEGTRIDNGQSAIDLIDRADVEQHPGWMVVKPFVTDASNCVLPTYVVAELLQVEGVYQESSNNSVAQACANAYLDHLDPVTQLPYVPNPTTLCNNINNFSTLACTSYSTISGYAGFNPATAPNDGEGFSKNLGGNQLPNAPHFTTSLSSEYTIPVSENWAATLHTDFYWQSQSWARVYNDNPYDKLHGYSNVNLSLILTSANGWQVMGYVKNVFNVTAITGDFLNSDDSGLTTNVFLTDPRLYGVRVTKQLDQGDGFWGSEWNGYDLFEDIFADKDGGKPPLWIEVGGEFDLLDDSQQLLDPPFFPQVSQAGFTSPLKLEQPPAYGFDENAKISYTPDGSDWTFSASVRYGRSGRRNHLHQQKFSQEHESFYTAYGVNHYSSFFTATQAKFLEMSSVNSQRHVVLDFQAGKDVGLGLFGPNGSSVVSLGARFAQFGEKSSVFMSAAPVLNFINVFPTTSRNYFPRPQEYLYKLSGNSDRSFHGAGPSVSWDASAALAGTNADSNEITLDWGANAAILFGRQRAQTQHQTTGRYFCNFCGNGPHGTGFSTLYENGPRSRNGLRSVVVPNVGGFVGISVRYSNAKISFGYRADEFFGAMDGGIDTHRSDNMGFFGPFANISLGLGG